MTWTLTALHRGARRIIVYIVHNCYPAPAGVSFFPRPPPLLPCVSSPARSPARFPARPPDRPLIRPAPFRPASK